ncbi:EAL domain-containing protein [Aliivibrio fischeri]|uniref:EAL domain-containing protein n=1 Tax=Aliivibrio fischeri TaxID=668 RepID=UPI0018C6C5AF|nr:EAL domain-containing protein [Aliivibrio fischeri]
MSNAVLVNSEIGLNNDHGSLLRYLDDELNRETRFSLLVIKATNYWEVCRESGFEDADIKVSSVFTTLNEHIEKFFGDRYKCSKSYVVDMGTSSIVFNGLLSVIDKSEFLLSLEAIAMKKSISVAFCVSWADSIDYIGDKRKSPDTMILDCIDEINLKNELAKIEYMPPSGNNKFSEQDLRDALENDEIVLVFQPLINLDTETICGVEALSRWESPKYGLIGPTEFLGWFAHHKLQFNLDEYVLDKAFSIAENWHKRGIDMSISVNVDSTTLGHHTFQSAVLRQMDKYSFPPKKLKFELTESKIIKEDSYEKRVMDRIQNMGFPVALDDYGSGSCLMSYVLYMNPQQIKVDRIFLEYVTSNTDEKSNYSKKVLKSVIEMIQAKKGVQLVVEGVETQYQVDVLRSLGCKVVQGWHFGRPETRNVIEERILKEREMCND